MYAAEWTGHSLLRLCSIQLVANNPKRFGIKLWAMADATNSYILQQQIYTAKNTKPRTSEVGLGTRDVLYLTQGYENQGYIIMTDNISLYQPHPSSENIAKRN